MNKETKKLMLEHIKEQTTDILGYTPNNNDLDGVISNILDDIQARVVEFTDFMQNEYQTGGKNNEIQ